ISNSSLLDEATAAAEAMAMAKAMRKNSAADTILVSRGCHPQTINVVQTRAEPIGVKVIVADEESFDFAEQKAFAVLLQYPDTTGAICDYTALIEKAHAAGTAVIMAADLLALTVLRSPGELG